MHDFLLKELSNTNLEKELINIGFDTSYVKNAVNKFGYKNFKIYNLNCAQANILKQTALSVGADCATNKEVIRGGVDFSSCILGGSISQLLKISQKLKFQPFKLKNLAQTIESKIFTLRQKTQIIGILNITKNSFSDGGLYYDFDNSVKHLHELIEDGADIIDIGAESTKPYSKGITPKEQISKLKPILEYIEKNNINIPISIDTRSSIVAQECINSGAKIINDVSGFDYDCSMVDVVSKNKVKVIIQHSSATPENMQDNTQYENLMDDIYFSLNKKINIANEKGIPVENIIVDPGIGFGKTKEQCFEIQRRWKEFKTLGCPVLIGNSRKSFLDVKEDNNELKDFLTLGMNSILINENIDFIRVHNVKIHKKMIEILSVY